MRSDSSLPAPGGYRPPAASRAFGSGGAVSLLALGAAIALWLPHAPITLVKPAAPLAVTFELAQAPSAPPAPPLDVPPGPVQHEQEASRAAKPKVQVEPVQPPLPSPPASAAPANQTADTASADARPIEQTTAPPALPTQSTAVAARVTSIAAERAALANWQSELLGHLKGFLRYPRQAQSNRQEGVAAVSVTVDRQGKVLSARIERGSGYPLLDAEAVAVVRRGSPVPPPTADIRGDPVAVTIPIQFSLRR